MSAGTNEEFYGPIDRVMLALYIGDAAMSDSEDLMHDQDRIEAYKQLRDRADKLGFASVNHALDRLEELSNEPQA